MITCLIHTRNSELHLEAVLESVRWCDEIVLVDMESTDGTIAIAHKAGARVVPHANIGLADPARQFGLAQTRGDWVLALDSDEIIPPALAQRLKEIAAKNESDVAHLCFRNYFFGRELKGSGWSWQNIVVPRFFKKGSLTYGDRVHDFIRIKPGSRETKLIAKDLAIVHFNYLDVSHFIQKLDRYTDFEARKKPTGSLLYQALRELGGRFFLLGGWRDGWLGFYLAWAMAFYRMTALAKARTPDREKIVQIYESVATIVNEGNDPA